MALMTGEQYRQSLRARRPMRVYLGGERLDGPMDHPIVAASVNSVALTYELAEDPELRASMTARSALTGETINRFCHLHQSTDDLVAKVRMQRLLGQRCGTCFQRCVGLDAFNALYATTYDIDAEHGTHYHERFTAFLRRVEELDLVVDGAMTDVKGDRSRRPSEQADLDLFLRVVERRPGGVVIRGAKAHQTGAVNSHEILVMPTGALRPEERDWAICCSVPADDPGLLYVYGRQSCDERKLDTSAAGDIDAGNACFGGQECLVVFEDVFVPEERIYLDGETEFASVLVERFAGYHRQSYGGCKVGVGDVLIGAAAAMAEYNGVERAAHVKDKIVEMVHLNETLFACGVACSAAGERTAAGNYLVDLLLANVCKQNVTRFPYEIARLLQDVAGGLFVTLPSARELDNPEVAGHLRKYLRGANGTSAENRMKMLRLVENLTLGRAAVGYLTESMHGAGSPQAQRIMLGRLAGLEGKKQLARALARIEED